MTPRDWFSGSGIIDAVAELNRVGLINKHGRFQRDQVDSGQAKMRLNLCSCQQKKAAQTEAIVIKSEGCQRNPTRKRGHPCWHKYPVRCDGHITPLMWRRSLLLAHLDLLEHQELRLPWDYSLNCPMHPTGR